MTAAGQGDDATCAGTLVDGWCRDCGSDHASPKEMAIRLDLTRKSLELLDRIRERGRT